MTDWKTGPLPAEAVVVQAFEACEKIEVVQAFRPAVSGRPEGLHYNSEDIFSEDPALLRSISEDVCQKTCRSAGLQACRVGQT
jgi:hypothetical protein